MPFVIDIDPVAFSLLGFPIRWYGLILVGAIAVAIWLAQREGRRRGIEPQVVSDGLIWVGAAALVGGRLLYVAQRELGSLAQHPAHHLMVWMGGHRVLAGEGLTASFGDQTLRFKRPGCLGRFETNPTRYLGGHEAGCCGVEREGSPPSEWR